MRFGQRRGSRGIMRQVLDTGFDFFPFDHNAKMISKIISGGQTGVDRAALDVALELGIACGGWCPKGRRAVDGVIPKKYPLMETATRAYNERTALNVRDSDGTLILNQGPLQGGTAFTVRVAERLSSPCLLVDLEGPFDAKAIAHWIEKERIRILNVAGPREEKCPGVHDLAATRLRELLTGSPSEDSDRNVGKPGDEAN